MPPRKSWTLAAVTRGDEDERAVWYFVAVFPPRMRHGQPAGGFTFRIVVVLPSLRIDWASGPPIVCRNRLAERRTRGLLQEWSQRSVLSRSSGSTGTTIGDFTVM